MGEAKATESPSDAETHARLFRYAKWVKGASVGDEVAVLAVCAPSRASSGWQAVLRAAAREQGETEPVVELLTLGGCVLLCWTARLVGSSAFGRTDTAR